MAGMVSRYPQSLEVPRPVTHPHLARNAAAAWAVFYLLVAATVAIKAVRDTATHGLAAAGPLWVALALILVAAACQAVTARMTASATSCPQGVAVNVRELEGCWGAQGLDPVDVWEGMRAAAVPTLEQVARHEAAHAVVAHHAGATVASVMVVDPVVRRAGWLGETVCVPSPASGPGERVWVSLLTALAGPIQDGLDESPARGDDVDGLDALKAATVLWVNGHRLPGGVTPDGVQGYLDAARAQVRSILAAHVDQVGRLARVVLDAPDRVLTLSAIQEVLAGPEDSDGGR